VACGKPFTQFGQGDIGLLLDFRPNLLDVGRQGTPTASTMWPRGSLTRGAPAAPHLLHIRPTYTISVRKVLPGINVSFQSCNNSFT
jgi:hypothetical protein